MGWQDVLDTIADTVMNCIEACFESINVVKGKRLVQVFIVCLLFLGSSIVLRILELPAFITWQEALPAVIVSAYLAYMDIINASVAKVMKKQLKIDLKKGKGGKNES